MYLYSVFKSLPKLVLILSDVQYGTCMSLFFFIVIFFSTRVLFHIDTHIKVVLMHDGKPLKKTKTGTKSEDANPEFDETFAFDVPQPELENVYIAISAICSSSEDSDHKLLGRLYIGLPFGGQAQEHWREMIHSPRNQVLQIHKLTEQ